MKILHYLELAPLIIIYILLTFLTFQDDMKGTFLPIIWLIVTVTISLFLFLWGIHIL
jgi:hypothetical protein